MGKKLLTKLEPFLGLAQLSQILFDFLDLNVIFDQLDLVDLVNIFALVNIINIVIQLIYLIFLI